MNRPLNGMTAFIIDTETDQGSNPRPVQVATIDLTTGQQWMAYFNSGRPISPITTQVHGITDADVAGLDAFDLANFHVPDYLIGHNVNFDWRVIGRPDAKLICTVRLARLAFPEWYSYKQSRCIEQLFKQQNRTDDIARFTQQAHDALGDVKMCYEIYKACCDKLGINHHNYAAAHGLCQTAKPRRGKSSTQHASSQNLSDQSVSVMPFGKYRGEPIAEVPKPYVKWVLANVTTLRPNLFKALEQRLANTL